jgi:mono/diheme cytochrome c family protein
MMLAILIALNFFIACEAERHNHSIEAKPSSEEKITAQYQNEDIYKKGQNIYRQYCNHCHPGGEDGVGPSLKGKDLSEDKLRLQIRDGIGSMPPFTEKQISKVEMDALIHYIMKEFAAN